jgi:hypothetical protein
VARYGADPGVGGTARARSRHDRGRRFRRPPPAHSIAPRAARPAALEDELPRHELETRALVDPRQVLGVIPERLRAAKAAGDWREQALLQLARANACRVLANWPCQRTASTAARMAAALAGSPVLQVRGLIAEARAYISMQEFNQGERLLGAAEHILEKSPSPELSADIDLAYSSLSYVLDKPELAADYAARGLHALGLRPALPIRVRLLRNQANALTRLGRIGEARQAIGRPSSCSGRCAIPSSVPSCTWKMRAWRRRPATTPRRSPAAHACWPPRTNSRTTSWSASATKRLAWPRARAAIAPPPGANSSWRSLLSAP